MAASGAAACLVLAAGAVAAPAAPAPVAAGAGAEGSGTVVVRGLAFPEGRAMRLGFVGCQNIYDRAPETPQAMIGVGPGAAPAGERSLRYDLAGGNAVGALSFVSSVALTESAGLTAYAADGTTGVVYAGYQEPADRRTGLVWFGRADVVVPAGTWTRIEATDLTYSWSKWDMHAQAPVPVAAGTRPAPVGTLADMVVRHRGDGAGFVMTGLGCDGHEFAMDALHLDTAGTATTYDLEGLATSTRMLAPPVRRVVAGQDLDLGGTLVDSTGAPLSGVTMMLESRAAGSSTWEVAQVVDVDGTSPSVAVAPVTGTTYRWRFADRPMAEGSVSAPFTVQVVGGVSADLVGTGTERAITGAVTPAAPGSEAVLWRLDDGAWRRVATAAVGPLGGYRFDLPADAAGRWSVTLPAAPGRLEGRSPWLTVAGASTPEASPSPSATQSPTKSPSQSPTRSPSTSSTPSATASPTKSASAWATASPTKSPTASSSPSSSSSASASAGQSASGSASPSAGADTSTP
ncbi:hypothetical protein [Nocardioides dokdonensis]|uniref:hypothetical protein n=1 Tax=Nocardioides dokdonensis TaxID=450734 RepID=UPI0012F8C40F|nr:hypothetical protein [Nocardioides dokdonensis]